MARLPLFCLAALVALSACGAPDAALGPDGKPLPRVYKISAREADQIQFRILDGVNTLRQASAAQPLTLNAALNAAALTHSRDMAAQARPWHFGSDGSSPLDRARRSGYPGRLLGENISESYETELETLAAWMSQPDTRAVALDPDARDLGFAYYQEGNGKIWWTLVTGG